MKISTKGRYALRFLIDLAEHGAFGFVSLRDVAERQMISKKYLEQIVLQLSHSGILEANRGSQGGYKLAKDPSEYTVGSILRITEGSLAPVACLECGASPCANTNDCPTLFVWKGLEDVISGYLDSITLQDILDIKG